MELLEIQGVAKDFEFFLGSRHKGYSCEVLKNNYPFKMHLKLYRGLFFPKKYIKLGNVLEEWHGSTHWSKDEAIARNFAYDYLNEDYMVEENLTPEDFANVVFVYQNDTSSTGYDSEAFAIDLKLDSFVTEREVTFFGTNFVMSNIIGEIIIEEKPYIYVEVSESI